MAKFSLFLLLTWIHFGGSRHPQLPFSYIQITGITVGLSLFFFVFAFREYLKESGTGFRFSFKGPTLWLALFFLWGAGSFFYSVRVDNSFLLITRYLGACVFLFSLTLYLTSWKKVMDSFWLISINSGLMALIGILQSLKFPYVVSAGVWFPQATGFFINPNFFGGYIIVHLPIACFLLISATNDFKRYGACLITALLLCGLYYSKSRGGQIAVCLEVIFFALYYVFRLEHSLKKRTAYGLAVFTLMFILLSSALQGKKFEQFGKFVDNLVQKTPPIELSFRKKISNLDKAEHENIKSRAEIGPFKNEIGFWTGFGIRMIVWRVAWDIFKDNPIKGSGAWTFRLLFPQYLERYAVQDSPSHIQYELGRIVHAHNIFIQTLADYGLTGFIFFSLAVLCIALRYFELLKAKAKPNAGELSVILSLLGYVMHNLIEYNWPEPAFIYFFAYGAYCLDFFRSGKAKVEEKKNTFYSKRAYPSICIILSLASLWMAVNYYFYNKSIQLALKKTSYSSAVNALYKSQIFCRSCDLHYLYSASVRIWEFEKKHNHKSLTQALKYLKIAERKSVRSAYYWIRLGKLAFLAKDMKTARTAYQQALKYKTTRDKAFKGIGELESKKR